MKNWPDQVGYHPWPARKQMIRFKYLHKTSTFSWYVSWWPKNRLRWIYHLITQLIIYHHHIFLPNRRNTRPTSNQAIFLNYQIYFLRPLPYFCTYHMQTIWQFLRAHLMIIMTAWRAPNARAPLGRGPPCSNNGAKMGPKPMTESNQHIFRLHTLSALPRLKLSSSWPIGSLSISTTFVFRTCQHWLVTDSTKLTMKNKWTQVVEQVFNQECWSADCHTAG